MVVDCIGWHKIQGRMAAKWYELRGGMAPEW
jgi:hypothetical protein